jgi:hypothetical protein
LNTSSSDWRDFLAAGLKFTKLTGLPFSTITWGEGKADREAREGNVVTSDSE